MQASNSRQVSRVIVIGPTRETMTIGNAIKSMAGRSIQVEVIRTVVPPSDYKLGREELLPKLKEKLSGSDSSTMVITDFGDVRPYKCEEIARDVKENSKNATVVLLTSKPECVGKPEKLAELISERGFDSKEILLKIDYVFQYTGVGELFPMMVDLQESKMNYLNDDKRAILVFESMPNFYSGYLTKLYGINGRKAHLLLARTYDEAEKLIDQLRARIAGAILGMRNPGHSFELLRELRAYSKGLPVIMQSGKVERVELAKKDGSVFALHKKDPVLMKSVENILLHFFGFGSFIFRLPSGQEIGRAENLSELCKLIETVDGASLVDHASRNDFSTWLNMNNYDDAAKKIQPMFSNDPATLRRLLLRDLKPFLK